MLHRPALPGGETRQPRAPNLRTGPSADQQPAVEVAVLPRVPSHHAPRSLCRLQHCNQGSLGALLEKGKGKQTLPGKLGALARGESIQLLLAAYPTGASIGSTLWGKGKCSYGYILVLTEP